MHAKCSAEGCYGSPLSRSICICQLRRDSSQSPSNGRLSLQQAKSEAAAAFGNDGFFLEKYIQNPRHIEFQKLVNICRAIVRCLGDDDLSVVEAALSVDGLAKVMDPPCLLGVYRDVLFRCIELINKSHYSSLA